MDGAVQQGGEAAVGAGRAAADAARRAAQTAAEGQHRILQDAAEQAADVGQTMAEVMRGATEDLRALMLLPGAARGGIEDLQQSVTSLVEGVVLTNARAAQELLRLSNPGAIIALQRRFMRDYLDVLMQGTAMVVRAARRTADETLQPLEREIEQRRQARESDQHGGAQHGGQREPQRRPGRVADVMSRDVRVTSPEATVQQAARLMREEDTGVLPVGEGDRLVGMVTDRDVALRLVAEARDPARTKVREVMTPEVHYVFEDDGLQQAAEAMAEQQVRRLPVLSREKRLVGVVSLGDLAAEDQTRWIAGQALSDIAAKGTKHDQAAAAE